MGLFKWLFGPDAPLGYFDPPIARPTVLGMRTLDGKPVTRVQRNTVPIHEEKGWKPNGTALRGQYRTRYKSFAGRIEDFETSPRFFIVRPPKELLNGPHAPCYQQRSEHTYEVHWARHPENAIAGILRIEYDLTEALTWEKQSQSGNF